MNGPSAIDRPWILFIEGLPGSGKSQTATTLDTWLASQGSEHRFYLENSADNPVGFLWRASVARDVVLKTTPVDYPFGSWTALAARGQSVILESRLLQNTALFAMVNGQEPGAWPFFARRILASLAATHRVALIVLRQSDPRAHLCRTIASRDESHPHWSPFVAELFTGLPWCDARGLTGLEAFVEALSHWSDVQDRIVAQLGIETLVLTDPWQDWPSATGRIRDFAGQLLAKP